ncbi:MAG: peptidylprolyl isomerase [Gillisia sp.]
MKKLSLLFVCAILVGLVGCKEDYPDLEDGLYAEFNTSHGNFVAELYFKETPITVANFVSLAEGKPHSMVDSTYKGKKFYDGLTFHRIIKDFMIQGGDPTGTGSGGPGYRFPDEIVDSLTHDSKGYLSMANAGPGTNGSQFFVTLAPTEWLDGKHTIFGKVLEGMTVVDSIGTMKTIGQDKPEVEVVIKEVTIIRKGKEAKDFKAAEVFENKLAELKAKEEEMLAKQEASKTVTAEKFAAMKEGAEALESGLMIHFLEKGEGIKPTDGSMIEIDYAGYFADGTLFDTSMEETAVQGGVFNQQRKDQVGYNPMLIPYGPDAEVIPGFKEGLQQMKVGDKAIIYIPSHLAYGERGAGNVIPPNTDLIFELHIVGLQE